MRNASRTATLADVARAAGVSLSTASRVLNGKDSVAPPMRRAVEEAIQQLAYVPDQAARSLRSGRVGAIGAIVADLKYEPLLQLVRAADQRASERGYVLAIRDARGAKEIERAHVRQLESQRVDGLLLVGVTSVGHELDRLSESGLPIAPDFIRDDQRLYDVRASGETAAIRDAVEHVVGTGHERLLIVTTGSLDVPTLASRRDVWSRVCEDTPLRLGPSDVLSVEPSAVSHALRESLDDRKTCIVSFTQPTLIPVLLALSEIGRSVPEDVSLLSFGDPGWARAWKPPINVVTRDMAHEGRMHMDNLISAIESDGSAPACQFEPSHYVRRGSVV